MSGTYGCRQAGSHQLEGFFGSIQNFRLCYPRDLNEVYKTTQPSPTRNFEGLKVGSFLSTVREGDDRRQTRDGRGGEGDERWRRNRERVMLITFSTTCFPNSPTTQFVQCLPNLWTSNQKEVEDDLLMFIQFCFSIDHSSRSQRKREMGKKETSF